MNRRTSSNVFTNGDQTGIVETVDLKKLIVEETWLKLCRQLQKHVKSVSQEMNNTKER